MPTQNPWAWAWAPNVGLWSPLHYRMFSFNLNQRYLHFLPSASRTHPLYLLMPMLVHLWPFSLCIHSFTLILAHQMVIGLLALMWFHSLLMLTLFSIYLSLILTPILSYHQDTLPVLLDYLLRFSLTSDSYIAHNSLQLFELSFTQLLLIQPLVDIA